MKRVLKWSGIILAVIVGLLILAVMVVNIIPGDQYKSLISSGVKSATGRDLVIEGELDIHLFTKITIKASRITFSNAKWGTQPHMVSVDALEGEVALLPLMRGILDVALVVDVTHATDHPSAEKKKYGDYKLGGGPVLYRGSAANPVVVELLIAVAEEQKIPYTLAAAPSDTGTDADAIYSARYCNRNSLDPQSLHA